MEAADAKNLMLHFNKTLGPFLERLDVLEPGSREVLLRNYLLHLSTTSLELPTVFFKESLADASSPVFANVDDCISVGIECIYVYDGDDDQVFSFSSFPQRPRLVARSDWNRQWSLAARTHTTLILRVFSLDIRPRLSHEPQL